MSVVMFICEGSCFSTVAIEIKLAYSYLVTLVTISFVVTATNTSLKPFNTVAGWQQSVQKRAQAIGEALWELTENHTMPWRFLLFSNSTIEKFCLSRQVPKTSLKASLHEHRALLSLVIILFRLVEASLCWLVLGLAIAVVDPFKNHNAEWFIECT